MEKSIFVSSRIESLRTVEKLVDELSSNFKLDSEVYGNLLIATLEAANNAIIHGNKLDENKKVKITINYKKELLKLLIEDQGEGFDYDNVPDPTAPENLENVNGRGIFLMRKLSDGVVFYDKGKVVELLFNLK